MHQYYQILQTVLAGFIIVFPDWYQNASAKIGRLVTVPCPIGAAHVLLLPPAVSERHRPSVASVLTCSATVRCVINMTAIAIVDAQNYARHTRASGELFE